MGKDDEEFSFEERVHERCRNCEYEIVVFIVSYGKKRYQLEKGSLKVCPVCGASRAMCTVTE